MTSFNPDILKKYADEIKLSKLPEFMRSCSLMFDEMKIKSGIVFRKSSGKVIGFTETGDLNDEILSLERSLSKKEKSRTIASHGLVLMLRGFFKHYNLPIAYFATKSASSEQLYSVIWEGVRVAEIVGFNVHALVCDGASSNRSFFEMHRMENGENVSVDGVVYWSYNPCHPDRKVYFISDPPHLMKTLRNNLENSGGNKATRRLMVSLRPTHSQVQSPFSVSTT